VRKLILLVVLLTLNPFTAKTYASDGDSVSVEAPQNPDFVILSFVQIKDDTAVDYKKALFTYAALTRKEPGNLAYVIHQSAEDYHKFVIYEHWASLEARTQHLAAPYTVQFFAQMKSEFLQGDPVRFNYQVLDFQE